MVYLFTAECSGIESVTSMDDAQQKIDAFGGGTMSILRADLSSVAVLGEFAQRCSSRPRTHSPDEPKKGALTPYLDVRQG